MILINDFISPTIFVFFFSILCIYFFKKKNLLLDKTAHSSHKKLRILSLSSPPLCGGIILYVSLLIFFKDEFILKIFSLGILSVGILSDTNKISSPKIRIILQFFLVSLFVFFSEISLEDLRVDHLNNMLSNKFISITFTIFCILILINGTNFLDGLNTLVIGYYILVITIIILATYKFDLILNHNIFFLLLFLCIIYFFNLLEKFYLGDSGSYLLAFVVGFFILDFFNKNNDISPYFISLLLWYPAFENLFSILRRASFSKKFYKPDQSHLHQIIFNFFVKKKFFYKKQTNSLTANLINFFNALVFFIFYKYLYETNVMVIIIILNIIFYLSIYFLIRKKA